jgi:hypothetical protein
MLLNKMMILHDMQLCVYIHTETLLVKLEKDA